jgi:cytoskeletal protein RodZ
LTEENGKNGGKLEEGAEQLELGEGSDDSETLELGGEETVGELLLSTREKKGLTLEAVSQETKVPVFTLEHLETDNFEAIPAKVYATGFLKTYAKALGLDPAQVINKYEVQTGQTHKSRGDLWEIEEEEVVEEKLDSPHLLWKLVIPVLLVVAAIVILWNVFGGDGGDATPPTGPPPADLQAGAAEDLVDTGPARERPAASGDAVLQPEREEAAAQQAEEEPEPAGGLQAQAAGSGEMTLRISAEERIWFDLLVITRTPSGPDTLETDFILEPGESRTFTANDSFYIRKIGKTEGFSIELDGRPYDVPVVDGRLPRDITISRDR